MCLKWTNGSQIADISARAALLGYYVLPACRGLLSRMLAVIARSVLRSMTALLEACFAGRMAGMAPNWESRAGSRIWAAETAWRPWRVPWCTITPIFWSAPHFFSALPDVYSSTTAAMGMASHCETVQRPTTSSGVVWCGVACCGVQWSHGARQPRSYVAVCVAVLGAARMGRVVRSRPLAPRILLCVCESFAWWTESLFVGAARATFSDLLQHVTVVLCA